MLHPNEMTVDADFKNYLRAAQGEETGPSIGDARWAETEAVAQRLIAASAAEAALKLIDREPLRRKRWDLLLLTGLLRHSLGERPLALECFEIVADKLAAGGDAEGVRALLPRFLKPEPTSAAVRFLEFLARRSADRSERIELLREALAIRPHAGSLHAALAAALAEGGDDTGAREHRLRAAEIDLDTTRSDRSADEMLTVVEHDLHEAPARVARILLRFASQAPWSESEPLLELAMPEIAERAPGRIAWEDLAPALTKVPATRPGRALASRILRIVVAGGPNPDAVVAGSGLDDPGQPIETVAARVPNILALPPGAHVRHSTFGVGRVQSSDGEYVACSFAAKSDHRMSFSMALRSLDRLPDDGLEVLAIEDPDAPEHLAREADPDLLVRVLHDAGGAATSAQIRTRIEAVCPGVDWSALWKRLKERAKEDPRIDLSEAYRHSYRLAPEGAAPPDASLPPLRARAAPEGLGLIRRFLKDHPGAEERLRDHAAAHVKRWMLDQGLDPPARAQALCYAEAWGIVERDEAASTLEALIDAGLAPDAVVSARAQDLLLDLSEHVKNEDVLLWRAAASRLPRIRSRARARLAATLGDGFAKAVEQRVVRGVEDPVLASRLIEHYAVEPDGPGAPPRGALLLATVRLLERDLPDGIPDRLLAMIAAGGAIRESALEEPIGEQAREGLERTVLHWSGSERRLTPVLEFLRALGLGFLAEEYERRRSARARDLLEGRTTQDLETRGVILSRATHDRLEAEMRAIALDLRTSIPAAIESARQLGDLRENAEYEAAKQRQASAAARLQELMNLLGSARILESLEIDDSVAGVGTEVELEPLDLGHAPRTYWILGEGDSALGRGVLSYRAPLARPLLGKPTGAEVVLETPEETIRFRIASIRKRLLGDPPGSAASVIIDPTNQLK